MTECIITIADLKVVSDDYAVHIVDTAHKVRSGKMTWTDGVRFVKTAQTQIRVRWAVYHQGRIPGRERELADVAHTLIQRADVGVAELLDIITNKRQPELDHFVVERLYPVIDPVTTALSQIIDQKILQCASSS